MTTTDTQSALLAAILADPGDDTARLVFADWLDENGHQERAEFIRVQVELARHRLTEVERLGHATVCGIDEMKAWQALRARELELQSLGNCIAWFTVPGTAISWTVSEGLHGWHTSDGHTIRTLLSRGFVSRITCTSADWLRQADAVYWHPTQTEECPECIGHYLVMGPLGTGVPCGTCSVISKGRIPRPMPPGAQPIERVVLTTVPSNPREFPLGTWEWVPAEGAGCFVCERWPGIVFEVRIAHRDLWQNYTTQYTTIGRDEFLRRMAELPPDCGVNVDTQ